MNRSFFRTCLACLSVAALASASLGCERTESIAPDLTAQLGAALVREQAPASAPASAPVTDGPAVVVMGPGAACVLSAEGTASCTGANNATARIAGLF